MGHATVQSTAATQMAGNTVSPAKLPSARQPAPLHWVVASANNGMAHAGAQAPAAPQASNSASSGPSSAASQEGTGGSGQSHVMPQGRAGAGQAEASATQAVVRSPSVPVGLHMQQAGYGASAYDSSLSGSMQAGMSHYLSSSQPYMMHGEMPSLLTLLAAYATSMLIRYLCKSRLLLVPSVTAAAHMLTAFYNAGSVACLNDSNP